MTFFFLYRAATNTHLLTEREKNKQTFIYITFVQSSVVCYIPLRDKGRQRNVSNSSLISRFVFFRWFYMLFMKFMKLGNHVFSFSLNYSRWGISDPNGWLRYYPLNFSLSATVSTIFTVGAKFFKTSILIVTIYPRDEDAVITPHLSCSTKSRYPPSSVLSLQR